MLQRTMNRIFEDLQGRGVEVYMDDIVVRAKIKRKHDELVVEALERIKRHKIKINSNKIQFSQKEVKLLGIILSSTKMAANEIKIN